MPSGPSRDPVAFEQALLRDRVDQLEHLVLRMVAAVAILLMVVGWIRPIATISDPRLTVRLLTFGVQGLIQPTHSTQDRVLGTAVGVGFLLVDIWVVLMIVLIIKMAGRMLKRMGFGRFVFVCGLIGTALITVFFLLADQSGVNTVYLGTLLSFDLGVLVSSMLFFTRSFRGLWQR